MPVAALSVPKDYLRYLPAKEKSAPSAPMTAVNTEIHAVNSFGLSEEEPWFSSLIGSFLSADATEVPAKATATAVAPATSALREKSFMMKSFRGVKVR